MKMRVQAQNLLPGDVVGSGEVIAGVTVSSIHWPSNKVCVHLARDSGDPERVSLRNAYWGKHTMINIDRPSTDITDVKPAHVNQPKPHGRRFGSNA